MTYYVTLVLLLLFDVCQIIDANVYGFDTSVCQYYNASEGGPMPSWALGYSTNVEWKILDRKITVDVQEYWDPIDKVRSITASIEGTTAQIVLDDKNQEYSTIINNKCNTANLQTEMMYFPDEYGLSWLTMTKDWYKVMSGSRVKKKDPTTVRSTLVEHWTSCLYVINFDITAQVDMYFATNWAMPNINPEVIIPVRFEIRGKINGTNSTAFHVIGDFFNFNPTPEFDPQKLQPPPGMFCQGKSPGMDIRKLPISFHGIIEIVSRMQHTITFQEEFIERKKNEYTSLYGNSIFTDKNVDIKFSAHIARFWKNLHQIWFHADKKIIRYDTKDSDENDSDPYMIILDFNTGIMYKIDKFIGTCESEEIVIGQYFVRSQQGTNTIDIVSVAEFFNIANANVQYVGKRWTRNILCDVWVGMYFDPSVSKNFTAEWYFAAAGWREAVGLSIKAGSFIKMDVFGGAKYPTSYNIHKMNPTAPPLSSFDLNYCYHPSQKLHFIIRFSVARGNLITQISQGYLKNTLQMKLAAKASIEPTRLTRVYTEYYGGSDFYLTATLLDKASKVNARLATPPLKQKTMDAAYDFIRGSIKGGWTQNITTTTSQTVYFVGVNIIRLNYRTELTTMVTKSTSTLPYLAPTLPHQATTGFPTPPMPPTTVNKTNIPTSKPTISKSTQRTTNKMTPHTTQRTTNKMTPHATQRTTNKMTPHTTQTPANKMSPLTKTQTKKLTTPRPCVCPKQTCPTITKATPLPTVACPTAIQTTTKQTQAHTTSIQLQGNCGALLRKLHNAESEKSSGISGGAVAGIAIAMLLVGAAIGVCITRLYHIKSSRRGLLNSNIEDY